MLATFELCMECEKQSRKAHINVKILAETSDWYQAYYDKDGDLHEHCAKITVQYECSNGHKWSKEYQRVCHCGWPGTQPAVEGLQ